MVISIPICLSGYNVLTLTILCSAFLLISAWHINYQYFGDVLGPDSLSLLVKPDHFRDVVSVGFDEAGTFLPTLAVAMPCLGLALYLVAWSPEHPFQLWFGAVAWLAVMLMGLRMAMRRRSRHDYPEAHMAGLFGSLHALAMAIKWGFVPSKPLPGSITYTMQPAQDALVVVVMGESINPARMGMFSKLNTTPEMEAATTQTTTWKVSKKVGFSAAVASNASVAGFLSGSPFPSRTPGSRSLFDLASAQGFATRYWSAQTRSPVNVLGDSKSIGDVYSLESAFEQFQARKDWHLIDKLEAKPFGKREFVFLYPRCNHSPYHCHEVGTDQVRPETRNQIVENYDAGMRTFDKFVAAVLRLVSRADGRVFVFITSDHNELLGDRDGLKGHSLSGHAIGAMVPYLLLTNDPDSEVFRKFSARETPNAWSVAELILEIMGVKAEAEPMLEGAYVGNSLPFNKAGYMKILGGCDPFHVEIYDRLNELRSTSTFVKSSWFDVDLGHETLTRLNHREISSA
jgi:hypothetical protein